MKQSKAFQTQPSNFQKPYQFSGGEGKKASDALRHLALKSFHNHQKKFGLAAPSGGFKGDEAIKSTLVRDIRQIYAVDNYFENRKQFESNKQKCS
mmetsp:Transcript_10126/g.17098  ORF Transcript_10126/g.17098 Transcript_10126/m.17098 type:complete len:95 (-) Transcript_10126:117-401(-)